MKKLNLKELILWVCILMLTLGAFYCTYSLHFSSPVQVIIWIVWLVSSSALCFFTSKGQEIYAFAKDSKIELLKVVWPTRQETIQTASIVMVMVAITGFILWIIDVAMIWLIAKITHLG